MWVMEVGSADVVGQCHLIRTQWSRRFCKVLDHLEELELKYHSLNSVHSLILSRVQLSDKEGAEIQQDVSLCQKIHSKRTKDIWGFRGYFRQFVKSC